MPDRHKMADEHEKHVAEFLGGRKHRGSGSQWPEKGDGSTAHFEGPFEWFWDCKSTAGQSISVTRAMVDKLFDEAHSGRPLLPLVFYDNDRLDVSRQGYLYVIREDDLGELIEVASNPAQAVAAPGEWSPAEVEEFQRKFNEAMESGAGLVYQVYQPGQQETVQALQDAIEGYAQQEVRYRADITRLRARVRDLEAQLSAPAAEPQDQPAPPATQAGPLARAARNYPVPELPWVIIREDHLPGGRGVSKSGLRFDERGQIEPVFVDTIRVEPDGTSVRLIVNEQKIPAGALYVDGRLTHQVRKTG